MFPHISPCAVTVPDAARGRGRRRAAPRTRRRATSRPGIPRRGGSGGRRTWSRARSIAVSYQPSTYICRNRARGCSQFSRNREIIDPTFAKFSTQTIRSSRPVSAQRPGASNTVATILAAPDPTLSLLPPSRERRSCCPWCPCWFWSH